VDVFRDGIKLTTTPNDRLDRKGGGTYRYRICEESRSVCSAEASVTF
jgi:hypothetical protein